MKNVLKAVILAPAIAIAPGCSSLEDIGISDVDFKITKINPLSGIAVEIKGKGMPIRIYDRS